MFYRFDTWVIAFIVLWLILGGAFAYVSGLKKRLDAAEKKNVDLRFALNRKAAELHQAKANAEAIKHLVIQDKNAKIEILRDKLKESEGERRRLETLLNQKWEDAQKTKGAKKNDVSK